MIRGLYISASGMSTQMRNQEVISNNLANVDTAGFKKDNLVVDSFSQMLIQRMQDPADQGQSPALGTISLGSNPLGTVTDFSEGSMVLTQRPLDFAVNGKGFFVVETPRGVAYTRQGSFSLSAEGVLVTEEGYPVMGENGPMEMGPNAHLDDRGEIVEEGAILNRLAIVELSPADIVKQGESLYRLTELGEERPAEQATAVQGYLESSNVNAVSEMVNMIAGLRSYEANQKALLAQDETLGQLIAQGLKA